MAPDSPHKIRKTKSRSTDEREGSNSNQKRRRDGDINEGNILPNKRRPKSGNTAEERKRQEQSKEDTRKQRELHKQAEEERKRRKKETPRIKYIEKKGAHSGALHRLIMIGPKTIEKIIGRQGQLGEKRRTRSKKGKETGVYDDGG